MLTTLLSMWTKLKSQLVLVMGALIGILILYVKQLENGALKRKLKRQQQQAEANNRANEALNKGLGRESEKVTRGYFDTHKH